MQEKRKSLRKEAEVEVTIRFPHGATLTGKILNITPEGALIQTLQLPPESATQGTITLVGHPLPETSMRICWMDRNDDGVLIGIEFLESAESLRQHLR